MRHDSNGLPYQHLGKQQRITAGFSTATQARHSGFIYYSDLIQNSPIETREKAQRTVAAKVVLTARMDLQPGSDGGNRTYTTLPRLTDGYARRSIETGTFGRAMRDKALKHIEQLAEPPPAKVVKALPVPDDGPKKRRGGKKYVSGPNTLLLSDHSSRLWHIQSTKSQRSIRSDGAAQAAEPDGLRRGRRRSGRLRRNERPWYAWFCYRQSPGDCGRLESKRYV